MHLWVKFAKSIGKNRNHLAFVVWEMFEKNWEGVAENFTFFGFVQKFSRQLLHLKIV